MRAFLVLVFYAASVVCQLSRDDERPLSGSPTRYVLPYAGLEGLDEQAEPLRDDHQQYYKPKRRLERIPASRYQYEDLEEEYYRPQAQPSQQKPEPDNFSYPSHKDYEQILKATHLARLRAAAKKQTQLQVQAQSQIHPQAQIHPQPQIRSQLRDSQPVEQYLKEVSPTTKTVYQRPPNYVRFNTQSLRYKQQEPVEEPERAAAKPALYRYVLQSDLQQPNPYPQYQYEMRDLPKPQLKPQPFNLVAYQNALIAQQKALAEIEAQGDSTPKGSIYVPQKTKPKQKPLNDQYEYVIQTQVRPQPYNQDRTPRPQQPLSSRNVYQKPEEAYQLEESLSYNEQRETARHQPQPPRQIRPRNKIRVPTRKPTKYQIDEQSEDYQQQPQLKYQQEEAALDDEHNLGYHRQIVRDPPPKYQPPISEIEQSNQEAVLRYQARPVVQYPQEATRKVPVKYITRQQYQEDRQYPQHRQNDAVYQPSSNVPVRYHPLDNLRLRYFRNLPSPLSYTD